MKLYYQTIKNNLGEFNIVVTDKGLLSLSYYDLDNRIKDSKFKLIKDKKYSSWFSKQLKEYFNNELTEFTMPLDYSLLTSDFALKVSLETKKIHYGSFTTYKHLSVDLDRPHSYSNISKILNHNPHLIVIPSHRVINSNGDLGSYIDSNLKAHLLELENALLAVD